MIHEGVALGGVILMMYPVIFKTGKGSLAPPSSSFDEKNMKIPGDHYRSPENTG